MVARPVNRNSTEVVYTTDAGYIVPTLASIASLRRWPNAIEVPVNIIAVGISGRPAEHLALQAARLGAKVHVANLDELRQFDNQDFNRTHVPASALARFYINDFIGAGDFDILYIDGDTWFSGDPTPLIEIAAPAAGLLAAEDQSYFYRRDVGGTGQRVREYFSGLGLPDEAGYFNSGVLKMKSSAWNAISADCLAFLRQHLKKCVYHDQSALNAVVGTRRQAIAPEWNFQTPYWAWGVATLAPPRLMHFVGGYKPWMGLHSSWAGIAEAYQQCLAQVGSSELPLRHWTAQEQQRVDRAEALDRVKRSTVYFLRRRSRRRAFEALRARTLLNTTNTPLTTREP